MIVIYESVAAIDDIYVRAGRALGATELELFRRVVVPLTVPQIFVAVRVALGVCWATVVAAELVAAQRGLGAMMQDAPELLPAGRRLRRHHPDRRLRPGDGPARPAR